MNIMQQINFRQPKYVFPAFLYLMSLGAGWLIIDMFDTELAEVPDQKLEKTEYLNPTLPQASIESDGIGKRTENMIKSFGRIQDYTAVENIDNSNEEQKEDYSSRYSDEDFALLDREAQARTEELLRLGQMQDQIAKAAKKGEEMASQSLTAPNISVSGSAESGNAGVLADLEKALAEARLKGRQAVASAVESVASATAESVSSTTTETVEVDNVKPNQSDNAVKAIDDDADAVTVVKVRRPSSSYFNTLGDNSPEPSLIKAIVDEEIKAVDGSRVRLRLLDDIELNELVLPKGAYLYATVSGFGSQRVKGKVSSLMVADELIKVNLSIYDTDGMEGFYVPNSSFRETANDIAGAALDNSMSLNEKSSNANTFTQWGMQAIQNAYQKTTSAISKSIRKNKANIKYGTFVYLVNGNDKKNKR